MSDPIIIVNAIRRAFETVLAVDDLSFTVNRGEVVGFIGANGSGKTTTMRMLVTLDNPDRGTIIVDGHDTFREPEQVRRKIGWMPDHVGTYSNMTVHEYIDFFARAYGLKAQARRERVQEVMDFTDLSSIAGRPCNKLSKGMTQRLSLGRTLLHDPEILVLDEPAAGLDPKARLEFKRLITVLKNQGKTVFISSHILSELGEMCDNLIFIDQGRPVHQGTADSLRYHQGAHMIINVRVKGDVQRLADWVETRPTLRLRDIGRDGAVLEVEGQDEAILVSVLKDAIDAGLPIFSFHRAEQRLEDAFVDMLTVRATPPPPPPVL